MIELMSTRNSPKLPPPKYGPGPQVIAQGDETYGYFGLVNESQIGLADTIHSKPVKTANYYTPSPTNSWAKFIRRGKVFFVPCFGFGLVSAQALTDAKMFYDVLRPVADQPYLPVFGKPNYTMNANFIAKDGSYLYVSNVHQGEGVRDLNWRGDSQDVIPSPGEFRDIFIRPFSGVTATDPVQLPTSTFWGFRAATTEETGRSGQINMQCTQRGAPNNVIHSVIQRTNAKYRLFEGGVSTAGREWCPILRFVPADEVPGLPT